MIIADPCNLDILFGKGGRSNNHEGNKRYNRLIEKNKIRYFLLTTNEDKGLFLKAIENKLCVEEGRNFVELDPINGQWKKATKKRIREKIRTALCDCKLKNALKIGGPEVHWEGSDAMDPFQQDLFEEEEIPMDDFVANMLETQGSNELLEDTMEAPNLEVPSSLIVDDDDDL